MPYLDYHINYDYISTQLCVNKDKSELNCKGNCYLNKQLAKTAEKESQDKSISQKLFDCVETFKHVESILFL
ncbi:MAG TPA: hypothetical protein VF691_19215, partial [Cytophagaceae bacterium]